MLMFLFHHSKMNSIVYQYIGKQKSKIKYLKAQTKEAVTKYMYNPKDNWLNPAWTVSSLGIQVYKHHILLDLMTTS